MQNIFHVLKVDHGFNYCIGDFNLLLFSKDTMLFVQLVIKTAIFEVLSDKSIPINSDTHPHVENHIRMFQIADDLQLLQKISFVCIFTRFKVLLNCDELTHILTLVDLAVCTLPYHLQELNILLFDEKLSAMILLQYVIELSNLTLRQCSLIHCLLFHQHRWDLCHIFFFGVVIVRTFRLD